MDEMRALLNPVWGSEKWIAEGWAVLTSAEKETITTRLNVLFAEGLPFELEHEKILYVYAFSMLAQLEVLAIQIPLKFADKMISKENQQRMRAQLLDEIFHGLVFTKIVYLLCAPYNLPPAYNTAIEELCNFVREEECPKAAIMLLNLVAEGWIEEAFKCFMRQNIAPKVFSAILADEHRHVCEADLYQDVGLPAAEVMREKLLHFEDKLLHNFFLQHRYLVATTNLLGVAEATHFIQALHQKHQSQLQKINLRPGKKWQALMHLADNLLPLVKEYGDSQGEIPMTPMRQLLMSQWDNSSDATMFSQSNINISALDFFSKKFPPETLTTLMLQTMSCWLAEHEEYRVYIHGKKLFRSQDAYTGIIVQLPGCRDHIATIAFANCHQWHHGELATRIRDIIPMMVYCYKRREELESYYPHLKSLDPKKLYDFSEAVYGYPLPGNPVATLSNVGPWGYTVAKSPLFKNEVMKFVMLQVERRQVWNKKINEFEVQDHLPISISADHRLYDGNTPVPAMLNTHFQQMYTQMLNNQESSQKQRPFQASKFIKCAEALIQLSPDFGHHYLTALQSFWPDFWAPQDLLLRGNIKEIAKLLA